MTSPAEQLTQSLRRGRWYAADGYGWACCPVHADRYPSLKIYDGDRQAVILHCKAGCDSVDVIRALRGQGKWGAQAGGPVHEVSAERDSPRRETLSDWGRNKWARTRRITRGDIAGRYLASRGVSIPPTGSALRWHHDCWLSDEHSGAALVGLVTAAADPTVTMSLQFTWLSRDARKIDRRCLKGHGIRGGVIRLFPGSGDSLGVAEGTETALALHKLTGTQCWSTINADNLAEFVVIDGVRDLIVAVDNDIAGRGAARCARARYLEAGARVKMLMAKEKGKDLADGGEVEEVA